MTVFGEVETAAATSSSDSAVAALGTVGAAGMAVAATLACTAWAIAESAVLLTERLDAVSTRPGRVGIIEEGRNAVGERIVVRVKQNRFCCVCLLTSAI